MTKKNAAPSRFSKGDVSWFTHDRFGMFIHWGLYSMTGRGEWIRKVECISDKNYERYFEFFDPDRFNAKEWAAAAREAGMKYFVITAKHHEGFCLWDSRFTDYKITKTAYKTDLLKELVDAFRAEGLKVGLYYSLLDWRHPHFPLDDFHPRRFEGEMDKVNSGRDMAVYRKYMLDQIEELLTNYGKVDIMWFDFSYPKENFPVNEQGAPWRNNKGREDWGSEAIVKLVRKLQPWVIIDNRLDLPEASDITTPEQYTPETPMRSADGEPLVWEGCQTFSGSWGYNPHEKAWKSEKQCIDMLINHVSCNGNLLMNVGPTARGNMAPNALSRLKAFGSWMRDNSRAIYGCGAVPEELNAVAPRDCRYTFNPKSGRLYLHVMNWPFKHLDLPGLSGKVAYAQFLHDAVEIPFFEYKKPSNDTQFATPEGAVTLLLPTEKPEPQVPVVEIFLKPDAFKASR